MKQNSCLKEFYFSVLINDNCMGIKNTPFLSPSLLSQGLGFQVHLLSFSIYILDVSQHVLFLNTYFIYLFLETGEWMEKERERNRMFGCLLSAPHWGPGLQPRHVP